jgi:hypothetical protein
VKFRSAAVFGQVCYPFVGSTGATIEKVRPCAECVCC